MPNSGFLRKKATDGGTRSQLEASEARLKAEYEAEGTQEIVIQDQVRTLQIFDQLIRQNEDRPERLKSLLPRFIDYVVWRSKGKGEGDIEVALFPNPVALAPEVVPDGPLAGGGNSDPGVIVSSEPKGWYARKDLNLQPLAPEASALSS